MPPFPHVPEKFGHIGHTLKFFAEVLWWALAAGWLLFKRAPRWLRIVLTVWFVLMLFSRCDRTIDTDKKPAREKKSALVTPTGEQFIRAAAEKAKADPNLTPADLGKLGVEFARTLAAGINEAQHPTRALAVVPFAAGLVDPAAASFAGNVFAAAFARLTVARPTDTSESPEPPAASTDAALVAHAKKISAAHLLAARLTDEAPRALAVRLLRADDGTLLWSATFPVDPATATAAAEQIATAVLAVLPPK